MPEPVPEALRIACAIASPAPGGDPARDGPLGRAGLDDSGAGAP